MRLEEREKGEGAQFYSKICSIPQEFFWRWQTFGQGPDWIYTSTLGPDLAMFAKSRAKPTLTETYEEAEVVEAERESIEYYPEQSGEKGAGRKALLFNKPKEEKSSDYKNMAKMV